MSIDCYCDYDPPEFFRRTTPNARKEHRCYECSGIILPGEQYENVAGKWDGLFETFKICQRCHDIRQWTENNVPCLCWTVGNMVEDCREAIEEATCRAPSETFGLRFGFNRRVYLRDKINSERRRQAAS